MYSNLIIFVNFPMLVQHIAVLDDATERNVEGKDQWNLVNIENVPCLPIKLFGQNIFQQLWIALRGGTPTFWHHNFCSRVITIVSIQ